MTPLMQVDQDFLAWLNTSEKKKEMDVQIENIGVKIVWVKGHITSDIEPRLIPHTFNISSDDIRVQKIFTDHFPLSDLSPGLHVIPKCHLDPFDLRFFPNRDALDRKLTDEETKLKKVKNEKPPVCALF